MKKVTINQRETLAGVHPLFLQRWSPRAFSSKPITSDALTRIIEAARWSPSCYNEQPWRIYTSHDKNFNDYLGLLDKFNQDWAKNAGLIGFIIAEMTFAQNNQPNAYAHFDCGIAWMAMTQQAMHENIYVHAMGGIDVAAATEYFQLKDNQAVLIGFAMGYAGDKQQLNEALQERETPSNRKPLEEIWIKSI